MLLGYTEDEECLTGLVKVHLEIQRVDLSRDHLLSPSVFLTLCFLGMF